MSYIDELSTLAQAYSISTQYTDASGEVVQASPETLRALLHAVGVAAGDTVEELSRQRIAYQEEEFSRPLPRCIVARQGDSHFFTVHVHHGAFAHVIIATEQGETVEAVQEENWTDPRTIGGVVWGEATFSTPRDLPLGWHTVRLDSESVEAETTLVVVPTEVPQPTKQRHGVMAQLYSVRSERSWGIGDFRDLATLGTMLAEDAGIDFLLINPLHAAQPVPPVEDSPYLPTSRRFVNPLYICVEDVPEYSLVDDATRAEIDALAAPLRELNTSPAAIDRDPIFAIKLQALRELFFHREQEGPRHDMYVGYCEEEGDGLDEFARWCGERTTDTDSTENGSHTDPGELSEDAEFYRWLQFICDEQLAAAQQALKDAGMEIGIMNDLAVGVHPDGADAETLRDSLTPVVAGGAPPDPYNVFGQDWSQPPWNPFALADSGYAPFRDMVRTVLRHSGALRIDHILGLFRLFWIPRGSSPATGTYMNYDYNALVGILALEATRAGAVVIGEDMGTFEPWVQDYLAERGLMGTSILWFEGSPYHEGPRRQDEYRTLALTSGTTHDLPPTAGMIEGEHIRLRNRLGLLKNSVEEEDASDFEWQKQIYKVALDPEFYASLDLSHRPSGDDTLEIVRQLASFVRGTPSLLTCTALVDLTGDRRAQNQPGTVRSQYPNWCVPLTNDKGEAVTLETLRDQRYYKALVLERGH